MGHVGGRQVMSGRALAGAVTVRRISHDFSSGVRVRSPITTPRPAFRSSEAASVFNIGRFRGFHCVRYYSSVLL
ncbi:hypothetical protein SDJN03_23408, partial [Cucurbita argyrosperma subsp. sororia]